MREKNGPRPLVALPKGSATQVLRRPTAAVDQEAERGSARQGAAAAADDGLGHGQGRGVVSPWLRIAVGEERDDPRRGSRRRRKWGTAGRQATISAAGEDATGPNANHCLGGRTGWLTPRPWRPNSSAGMFAVQGRGERVRTGRTCWRWARRRGYAGDCRAWRGCA